MAATSTGTIASGTITNTSFTMDPAAGWLSEKGVYDRFLYGAESHARTFVPAPAPPVQRESLDLYERMMTGPRPVPDYPIPLFVGDYVNGIILPADWDPNGHMEGEGAWQNRTRFFSEGRLWNYKRIPLAPRLPGA